MDKIKDPEYNAWMAVFGDGDYSGTKRIEEITISDTEKVDSGEWSYGGDSTFYYYSATREGAGDALMKMLKSRIKEYQICLGYGLIKGFGLDKSQATG